MEIYTVSFFGHRYIDNFYKIEEKLEEIIRKLIREHEYVDFLVGRDGDFDQIVSSTIKRVKRDVWDCNSSLIWVMPYPKAEYSNNQDNFEEYYDEIEVCYESCKAHPKSAIQIRNKYMVNRSDLTVFYVETTSGGAYQTMKYATKCEKNMVNIKEQIEA